MKTKLQNVISIAFVALGLFISASTASADVVSFEELKQRCQEMESNSQITPFTSEITCKQKKSTWVKTDSHSFPVHAQSVVRVKADLKDGQINSDWLEMKSCDKESKYGKCSTVEHWDVEGQFHKTIRSCEELKGIVSAEEYCRASLAEVMHSCEDSLVQARMNAKEPCHDVCQFTHKETLSCVDQVSCPTQQAPQKTKVEPAHDCPCDSSSSCSSSSDCHQATQQTCPTQQSKTTDKAENTSSSSSSHSSQKSHSIEGNGVSISHSSSDKNPSISVNSLSLSSSDQAKQAKVVVTQESISVVLKESDLVAAKYRKSALRQNYKAVQFQNPPTQGSIWCQMGFKQGSYVRKISGNRVKTPNEVTTLVNKAFEVGSIKVKGVIDGEEKTFIAYREPDSDNKRWAVVEQ